MSSSLSTFPFMENVFDVSSKNSLPSCSFQIFSPIFLKSFIILCFTFKSTTHFEFICVSGVRFRFRFIYLFFLPYGCSIDPAPFDENTLLPPLNYFLHPCQKSVGYLCVGLFLDFLFCSLTYVYTSTIWITVAI